MSELVGFESANLIPTVFSRLAKTVRGRSDSPGDRRQVEYEASIGLHPVLHPDNGYLRMRHAQPPAENRIVNNTGKSPPKRQPYSQPVMWF